MSDLFYYDQPNPVRIRGQDCKFENVYQKNNLTGEYERVGGGGSGGDLPYYLKPNSIDIDDVGNVGTELTATALTFGDSTGNVSINLAKAKVLDQLKTVTAAAAGRKYLQWDAPTQNFVAGDIPSYLKTENIMFPGTSMINGGTVRLAANGGDEVTTLEAGSDYTALSMEAINIDSKSRLTESSLRFTNKAGTATSTLTRQNLKQVEDLHTMLESTTPDAGTNNVLMGYNPTTKKLIRNPSVVYLWNSATANAKLAPTYLTLMAPTTYTNINTSSVRLSDTAGVNTIGLDNPTGTPSLQITKANATLRFLYEDIDVTNKLKALAAGTPGANSKMLIYDTTTKAFNHATIPSGGGADLPSYIKPNSIDLVTTSMENSAIKISDPTSGSLLRSGYLTLQKIAGTTTNANLTFDGVQTVENLETLTTTPRLTKKLVVYDPATKVFNHADQNPNELTDTMVKNSIVHQKWKPVNVAGSEFYAPDAEAWGFRPIRRWLDIKKTGDTLFIDCSNYNTPMANGAKLKMVFDVGLYGAAMLDATYENANITASCLYSQVVYKTGIPIENEVTNMRWLYTLTLTATAATYLNAMIRIKVVDEIAGIRSNVEMKDPTFL